MTDDKIVFLFGAGAECGKNSFNLPSGADFLLKTMLLKNKKLYRQLGYFYRNSRLSDNYVKEYRPKFLFEKGSHTFREIIFRAAKKYLERGGKIADYSDYRNYIELVEEYELKKQRGEDTSNEAKGIRKEAEEIYEKLIKNSSECCEETDDKSKKYFKDYLSFYGAVEKDFSTIIDPNNLGLTQFWRVINYLWSAFFAVFEPTYENTFSYKQDKNEYDEGKFYQFVLNDLRCAVCKIYNEYDYASVECKSGNYYKAIKDNFGDCSVITTNYTPFVEHYFAEKSIYLAGRLCDFEFPTELTVKNILDDSIDQHDFLFPFIMTQSPIKPIIIPGQIENYQKAICKLKQNKSLVIIGYSMDSSDNHINAILRDYLTQKDKKLIYCQYTEKDICDDDVEKIYKKLCVEKCEELKDKISIIKNDGNVEKLIAAIKKEIKEQP